MRRTKWEDVNTDACESKAHQSYDGDSRMGYKEVFIDCPFCGTETLAYKWSLCGGGKRCENRECGAMHGSLGMSHRLKR